MIDLFRRNRKSISGQSGVEFCMTIIFFIFFSLATVEFTSLFVEKQRVCSLSREAANASFRECYDSVGSANIQACLENPEFNEKVYTGAKSILKNFETKGKIIVSYYVFENGNGGKPADTYVVYKKGGGQYPSKYNAASTFTTGQSGSRVVCVGEIYYHHDPSTPIGAIMGLILPENVYESTIY